ncbi:MAG: SulP family inorganic anion transporter [Gammaproteobacteria bacterium]|nr:MAG: SulP family inorganic anion transporter [Gammaproteobacteria bacterium]
MRTRTAGADLLAGLSIAGLLLPEAVAYSGVASLPPQAGVIALFAGLLCYGLIGRSRVAIVTATSSSAAVLASATLTLGGGDLALRLALASILVAGAGAAFVLAAALRLGALSHLIARPVLRGYAFGLALVIAVKQWPHLVNLHTQATGFFPLVAEILRAHPSWHWPSLACGLAALAGLTVLERVPRMPGALIVIASSILASSWLNAQGVALTGPIKRDEEVQPNRDLLALGVANILCGLLQGTPVGAGYSATSANAAAGARSPLAGLYSGAVVLALVLLSLRWVERIPEPALAAIVIHAVSKALRPGVFADYFRWQRDRMLVVAAVLTVMIFGVLNGLLAGIAFSLALLLKSLASPRLSVLGRVGAHDYVSLARFAHAVSTPGVLIVRPEQPLFFANAEPLLAQVRQRALAAPDTKLVILSLEESPDLDSTTLEALEEFCSWLAARGVQFRVARLKELAREALLRAKLAHLPASALDYSSVDDAVRGEGVSPTQQA